ncbi:MAG TPA: hypothetical protein VFG78_03575 [Gemmatimonadota bacterium]|nr:hypothetical protein [Gemmatimonadota bacterium]
METTERIVEAYVRYIKGWFTLPNIKCEGQLEIDLLALDPRRRGKRSRYHIESGVSISGSYSMLTSRPFSSDDLKIRVKMAGQRRTLGYFVDRKFGDPRVVKTLEQYGFKQGAYQRVVVSWGWREDVVEKARFAGVELWDFRELLAEIADSAREIRTYSTDDTIRTLQLMSKALASQAHRDTRG